MRCPTKITFSWPNFARGVADRRHRILDKLGNPHFRRVFVAPTFAAARRSHWKVTKSFSSGRWNLCARNIIGMPGRREEEQDRLRLSAPRISITCGSPLIGTVRSSAIGFGPGNRRSPALEPKEGE
jgi:hypothetical protein